MNTQTLVLKDVPAAKIADVEMKYKMMGAKIERTKQDNGLFTLRITVEETLA
jgi:hypothetical protein